MAYRGTVGFQKDLRNKTLQRLALWVLAVKHFKRNGHGMHGRHSQSNNAPIIEPAN
jgi:hypothetical protein